MGNQNLYDEYHKRRSEGNKKISEAKSLDFNRFIALDTKAYAEGEIPAKYKELMGLVGSMVLRCNDCILYHIEAASKAGCTKKELLEAMNIALVIGGSVVIPSLRTALTALDELEQKTND
jgi:AhpD family alkylhydroperoxidase